MSNEPLGGRVEGPISKGIEEQTALAKDKRRGAVERLAEYGQAVVDRDDAAAKEAMAALIRNVSEASEAERWVRKNQDVLGRAKTGAPRLGTWRDIINAGQASGLAPE